MSRNHKPPLHQVFFALSDPTRLDVVRRLGRRSRRASELAEDLGVSRPKMSRLVGVLRAARVVREEADPEDGRARILVLDNRALSEMHCFLEGVSSSWEARLDTFKTLAEQRAQQERSKARARRRAS